MNTEGVLAVAEFELAKCDEAIQRAKDALEANDLDEARRLNAEAERRLQEYHADTKGHLDRMVEVAQ